MGKCRRRMETIGGILMDKDFELQWKDEQIAELRSALSGTSLPGA